MCCAVSIKSTDIILRPYMMCMMQSTFGGEESHDHGNTSGSDEKSYQCINAALLLNIYFCIASKLNCCLKALDSMYICFFSFLDVCDII